MEKENKNICVHHIIPRSLGGTDDPSNLEYITFEEHADRHDPNHKSFCGVSVGRNSILWRNSEGLTCRATINKYKNEIIKCLEKKLNTGEIIEALGLEFAKSTVDKAIQWLQKEYNLKYNRRRRDSEETRQKMSGAKKGEKHPMYGKKHPEETKRKMSEVKKGEKHPRAKLTWEKVYDIRWLLKNTSYTHVEIAKVYNVDRTTIASINNNGHWKEPTIWWK